MWSSVDRDYDSADISYIKAVNNDVATLPSTLAPNKIPL